MYPAGFRKIMQFCREDSQPVESSGKTSTRWDLQQPQKKDVVGKDLYSTEVSVT